MRKKIIWFGVLWLTALSLSRAQTETPTKKKEILTSGLWRVDRRASHHPLI
jgi:steroid 5-alpha reductase family enzyme